MNICEPNWNVAIVGAGPAGSFAAHQLALRGFKTLLIEKSPWPREKVCGGCLSNVAVSALRHAGLASVLENSAPIDRVIWHTANRSLELHAPGGAALLRSDLDSALVKAAQRHGCTFLPATSATLLPSSDADDHRTLNLQNASGTITIRAKIVLACDGIAGTLLSNEPWAAWHIDPQGWMGVSTTLSSSTAQLSPLYSLAQRAIHMHIAPGGYVGLVQLPGFRIHLAAALDPAICKTTGGPAPLVQQILNSCNRPAPDDFSQIKFRGTALLTRHRTHLGGHRVLAIGDACGYIEPFTGEGMAWAILDAREVAAMLPAPGEPWPTDMPQQWQSQHQKIIGRRQRWCRSMKPMMHHPTLASVGITMGRSMPAIGNYLARQICRVETELTHEPTVATRRAQSIA